MPTFVTKEYKGKTVHCSMSDEPIEIKGHWYVSGRMPIDKENAGEGAPSFVFVLFENNPELKTIVLNTSNGGQVYSR